MHEGSSPNITAPPSVPLTLLRLAGPTIASMISRTIMSFIDLSMVSQLGTEHQAAFLPASMILFTVISFGMGAVTAVATFVSQSYGRQRYTDCASYAWQGLYLSLLFGLLAVPLIFCMKPILAWIGHAPRVQELEASYAMIGLLSVGPSVASIALSNFFNGIHKPSVGFFAALAGNAVNIILNYALIFGHFGCPKLGMAGAAWATTIATCTQVVFMLGWMMLPGYVAKFHTLTAWKPDVKKFIRLVRIGFPIGIQFSGDILAWTIFTTLLVGRFGTAQLAANNVCFQYMHVAFMPSVGLGFALTAAFGKSVGESRLDLAREYVRWASRICMIYMTTIGAMLFLFRYQLMDLLTDDPDVIFWGARIMIFCAIFQVFDALGISYQSALRGAGDTTWPAIFSLGYAGVVFLGGSTLVAYLLPQWQSMGPWGVASFYIALYGITMWLRFLSGRWMSINLMDHEPGYSPVPVDEPMKT